MRAETFMENVTMKQLSTKLVETLLEFSSIADLFENL